VVKKFNIPLERKKSTITVMDEFNQPAESDSILTPNLSVSRQGSIEPDSLLSH
jgi:hypothetical protein